MKHKEILWLLPLLTFYLIVCIAVADDSYKGDEIRYAQYAENLTKGFYAPKDTLYLWNGPGYPIILAPFAAAKIPYIYAKYLNPFFLFAAMCFIYLLLRQYITRGKALLGAYLLGLYPPFLPQMPNLLTESLSVFLVSGFAFFVVKHYKTSKISFMIIAAFFAAYLMLTKIIFVYVFALIMLTAFIFCLWNRRFVKAVLICFLAFVFCTPYLFYTWHLTGKLFYWANCGGINLYWMSNPHQKEWGDYRPKLMLWKDERVNHHLPLFEKLKTLNYVERDELLKQKALENIRQNPGKYCKNLISNFGRLWFDYPFSYKYQRPQTLFYTFSNSFLLSAFVFCIYPILRKIKQVDVEIIFLGLFSSIFIGLSLCVFTYSRYLVPIVPALAILPFYTFFGLFEIRLKENK